MLNHSPRDYHPTPVMVAIQIFLLILIIVGIVLLFTQDAWVPQVVDFLLKHTNIGWVKTK